MRAPVILILAIGSSCDIHHALGSDGKVHPTSPAPGAGTGTGASGSMPTLSWSNNPAADSYEVQVDNSCQIAIPCDFPSPEIDVMVSDPSYVPQTPLAVPNSGPQRQTYCWRVRGCHQGACGAWSDVRCFVVGAEKSLNRDLNGDGYADLVVGAPEYQRDTRTGRVAVYLGGTSLPAQPALVLEGTAYTSFGGSVAMAGDLNGDGYGDYLVARGGDTNNMNGNGPAGEVMVFLGGPVLRRQPDVTFTGANQQYSVVSVTGCGDLNGDGYDDLAFVAINYPSDPAQQPSPSWVEIHFGGPDLATSVPLVFHGGDADALPVEAVAAGDVNGDGYPDLLVSYIGLSSSNSGGAMLFLGGPAMDAVPDAVITVPGVTVGTPVAVAGVGDVNGDGFADLAFGVASGRPTSSQPGATYIFFGGSPLSQSPGVTLPEDVAGEGFGIAVLSAGDLNQDGYSDIAVLSQGTSMLVVNPDGHGATAKPYPGKVSLFAGGPTLATAPFSTITAPADHASVFNGASFDFDGDGVPELLVSQWSSQGSSPDTRSQVAVYRASNNYAAPARVLSGFSPGDDFGIALSR